MWRALLLLVLGCVAGAASGEAVPLYGQALQQRFGVADHDAGQTSFGMLALPDGSVLIANVDGVLHFDGSRWELFELPGVSPARALYRDHEGRIFVGGYDHFGQLETDESGRFRYRDLRGEFGVDGDQATFGIIWEIVGNRDGVFFRSSETLYVFGYDGEREQWPLGPDFRRMFMFDDVVHLRLHGRGFGQLDREGFRLVAGGELFAELPLSNAFKHPDGLLLVSTKGLHIADAEGIRRLPSGADQALLSRTPSAAAVLPVGGYLLGTDSGELIQLGADLQRVAIHSVGSLAVREIGIDREGGVWVIGSGELVRMRLPSPWSVYTADAGLLGSPSGTAYFDGALWVATSAGIFRSQLSEGDLRFELAIKTALEAYELLAVRNGLLVGEREGLLWHHGSPMRTERLHEGDEIYELLESRFHEGRVYALGSDLILLLQRDGTGWKTLARWSLDGMGISTLLETAPDTVWLDDWRGVPQRWTLGADGIEVIQREDFGPERGLDWDPAMGSVIHELGGQIFSVSGSRVFQLRGERFEAFTGAPFSLFERPFEMGLAETAHGDFAFGSRQLFRRLPGTDDWQLVALGGSVGRGFFGMQTDEDGLIRVKTWGGLLQFDPGTQEPPLVPLAVQLRRWSLRQAEGADQDLPLEGSAALELASGDSLSFDFSMPTMEPGVEFRYRIDGLDGAWSPWSESASPSLVLRAPDHGSYRLRVEGRTRSGRVGAPLSFEFSVRPTWWQTGAARLGLVSAGLLLVLLCAQLIARLRYRHYLAANRRLEDKITERTAELQDANRKLAELAIEDSLTGVANRRALEQALSREWERCAELAQPLAVIMIDVDHFKQFNDRHGHLEGDKQLIRVARELSGRVRPVRELLARFGGEEFAVILPGIGMKEALARAETMRAAFDRESSLTTVSVGVAAQVPDLAQSPTELLRAADEALYAAKRQGRNRVMAAAT